jgi:hypothetical protein
VLLKGSLQMMAHRRWLPIAALLVLVAPAVSGQGSVLTPAQAAANLAQRSFEDCSNVD